MYNAYGLTAEEAELLIKIADGVRDNIIEKYKAGGLQQIEEGLTEDEVYDREMLDMMSVFNSESDRFSYALMQTEQLKWILEPLARTFGEDAIFDLLPDEAKTEEAVEVYYKFYEHVLANLCDEAMRREENKPPSNDLGDSGNNNNFKHRP